MQTDEMQSDVAELLASLRKARDAQPQQPAAVGRTRQPMTDKPC